MKWREENLAEGVRLICGDCREILPTLGKVDAVITDPPYGIGIDRSMAKSSGAQSGGMAAPKGHYIASGWDDEPIGQEHIDLILASCKEAVIFGGNYFVLPPSKCWLVWDKKNGSNDFADCELAWTNLDKPVRRIEWMWNGMLRKGGEERNGHPTQKPLGVMAWCIEQASNPKTILDPFMGSGTTGVACANMGKSFYGIEREPKYFDIACKRIQAALDAPDMFVEAPKPAKQEAML